MAEMSAGQSAEIARVCWRGECRNGCYYLDCCSLAPPPTPDAECCASGRCEVCTSGFDWGRDG